MLSLLTNLAQASMDYGYDPAGSSSTGRNIATVVYLVLALLVFAAVILTIVGMWKVFQKAGKPGWASIIPFYNTWVTFEIAGKPGWYSLLAFIPILGGLVELVLVIMAQVEIGKRFGKDIWFAVLMILLPFIAFPILGLGDARYHDPEYPDAPDSGLPPAAATSAAPMDTNPPAPQATPAPTRPTGPRPPRLIQ